MSKKKTTHPIELPSEPGLYESAVLLDRTTIRVNDLGHADAIVERGDTRYESAILDLRHYAREFGPFRRLDAPAPAPKAEPKSSPKSEPAPAPETGEEGTE